MTTDPVNWGGARRRLDAVFGNLLPSVTSDELDIDEPERNAAPDHGSGGGGSALHSAEDYSSAADEPPNRESARDAELLANRPPHHDRD